MDDALLEILVCPQDHTPLRVAEESLIERLNRAIADENTQVVNSGGRPLEHPLCAGLVRQDDRILYPLVDGISVLLADEAIALEQIDG